MAKVEMYGATWCGYTLRARALLDERGVEFTWIDVDKTPEARKAMAERGGGRTLPQIFISGVPIGGCDELHALDRDGRLDHALKTM